MPFQLKLIPDLFVPKWESGSDQIYVVLQPVLELTQSNSTQLVDYLKTFSVPGVVPQQSDFVFSILTGANSISGSSSTYVPVPLPDNLRLTAEWRDSTSSGVVGLTPITRDYSNFALINSYADYVRANHIYPRKFAIPTDETGTVEYPYWWKKTGEASYQPERYDGAATYSQILAHQMVTSDLEATGRGAPSRSGDSVDRLEKQISIAFAVGRLIRFYTAQGDPIFGSSTGSFENQVLLVPDLLPDERWSDIARLDYLRWHTNVHSLCGLFWPIATRDEIQQLDPVNLPNHLKLTFASTGTSGITPSSLEIGDNGQGNPFTQFFKDVHEDKMARRNPISVARLSHLPDFNKTVFAINKSQPLSSHPQLNAFDESGRNESFVHFTEQQDSKQRAARNLAPLELLDVRKFESLTILSNNTQPIELTLAIQIPGKFKFYRGRKFKTSVAGQDPVDSPRQLLQFHPDRPLRQYVVDLMRESFEQNNRRFDLIAFLNDASPRHFRWNECQTLKVFQHTDSAEFENEQVFQYQPVLFFDGTNELTPEQLEALLGNACLVTSMKSGIQGEWQSEQTIGSQLSMWRTRKNQLSSTSELRFNLVSFPNLTSADSTSVSLWFRDDYSFHFARSARHFWLPLLASYSPLSASAFTDDVSGGLNDVLGIDSWMHKELNIYVKDSTGGSFEIVNRDTVQLSNADSGPVQNGSQFSLSRAFAYLNQIEPSFVGEESFFPIPASGSDYELRYPNWPTDVEPRPQFNGIERLGKKQIVALGFEHQYGTQQIGQDGTGSWQDEFSPVIDWPFTDPTQIKGNQTADDRENFFITFALPYDANATISNLEIAINGSWLKESVGDDEQTRKRSALCRKAAFDLRIAEQVSLLVSGFEFDLFHEENRDGSGHDRHFSEKLRPAPEFNTGGEKLYRIKLENSQRQEVNRLLGTLPNGTSTTPSDGKIILPLGNIGKIHEKASLVECEIEIVRPDNLIPKNNINFHIIRPRLGEGEDTRVGNTFSIAGDQIVNPNAWNPSHPEWVFDDTLTSNAEAKRQLKRYVEITLKTFRGHVHPVSDDDRTNRFRERLNLLTTQSNAIAPEGFLKNPSTEIRHAAVPLAFLPIAKHPAFFDATNEVFLLLLRTLSAYNKLQLNEFGSYGRTQWEAFFQRDGGKLPLNLLRSAIARTLTPIAAESTQNNLSGERADEWRAINDRSSPHWPQKYIADLLDTNLLVYEEMKSLLVHVLRKSSATFPGYYHSFSITKDAKEEDLANQSLNVDRDNFSYNVTTSNPNQPPKTELLVGDLLDDITYDNEFEIEQLYYKTAEEFIESLEPEPKFEVQSDVVQIATELDSLNIGIELRNYFDVNGETLPAGIDKLGIDIQVTNQKWLITVEPEGATPGRTYVLERTTAPAILVARIDNGGRTITLASQGMELPFGPNIDPNDPSTAAMIGLVARRPPTKPLIVFQGTLDDKQFGGSTEVCLSSLEMISDGTVFADCHDSSARFERTENIVEQNWSSNQFVDQLTAGILVAIDADEEGQLNRDDLMFRLNLALPSIRNRYPVPLPRSLTEEEVMKLRDDGPTAQKPADILKWLNLPTTSETIPLEAWMAEMVEAGLEAPAGIKDWADGFVRFDKSNDKPVVQAITTLTPKGTNEEIRVALFRPFNNGGDAQGSTHLVSVESKMIAGEKFFAKGYRLIRNAERNFPKLGINFVPDPRFAFITSPAQRPTPFRITKVYDVSKELPGFAPIVISRNRSGGLTLSSFRAALVAHGLKFKSDRTLGPVLPNDDEDRAVRVIVDHAYPNPAPTWTFVGNGSRVPKSSVGTHEHPIREFVKLFRFQEPGLSTNMKIHLPEYFNHFLIDVHCVADDGGEFLKILNIPAIPQ